MLALTRAQASLPSTRPRRSVLALVMEATSLVPEGMVSSISSLTAPGRTELMVPQKVLRALVSIFFLLMSVGG